MVIPFKPPRRSIVLRDFVAFTMAIAVVFLPIVSTVVSRCYFMMLCEGDGYNENEEKVRM